MKRFQQDWKLRTGFINNSASVKTVSGIFFVRLHQKAREKLSSAIVLF
jgi:hypothetical protein